MDLSRRDERKPFRTPVPRERSPASRHFRTAIALSFATLAAVLITPALAPPATTARQLTLEDRVLAQAAIERVYHRHQQGTRRSFEEALPREALVARVEDDLRKSVALERFFSTPVTAEMLGREVERMVRDTRMPERLTELFAALDNDALLIQECLARPILVDRLARRFFAADSRLHAAGAEEIEALRAELASGAIDPAEPHPRRRLVELVRHKAETTEEIANPTPAADGVVRLDVGPEAFERELGLMPREIGAIGPVQDTPEAFVVRVLLDAAPDELRYASFAVPKRAWDAWWGETRAGVDAGLAVVVAEEHGSLSELASPASCVDGDGWVPGALAGYAPIEGRVDHTAVWTGSEWIVWGGGNATIGYATGASYDPATDTWRPTSSVGAPTARRSHTAVWTGSVMVVWGGSVGSTVVNTGGRYDPSTDTWTPTSTGPNVPVPRSGFTSVWTGSEMVVWGGWNGFDVVNTGGRYNPSTDTWTPTALGPTKRSLHTAVWTGSEMIIWSGWDTSFYVGTGGRYNPATNTWTPTSTGANSPIGRYFHTAVWTGSEMIVWGGLDNTGGRYNPATNTWTPTSTGANVPSSRAIHTAVWTGSWMLVWGGRDSSGFELGTGASYNPSTNTWLPISTVDAPSPRDSQVAVWTGDLMVVWGGHDAEASPSYLATGGRYDPATGTWTPTWTTASVPESVGATAVWTGNEVVVWGGSITSEGTPSGGRYDPTTDAWRRTALAGAPSPRDGHTAVWTGDEMIVWGGEQVSEAFAEGTILNTGGRYDPLANTWTATASSGAPHPRKDHTAVWTGSQMIAWGGSDDATFDSGGRYDPVTDAWTPTSAVNVPLSRENHSAVWTGSRMIVWGGRRNPPSQNLGDGALYDPATDSWTPTSTSANVPTPRRSHEAVWTGSEMIVWGGYGSSSLNTGARYDPGTALASSGKNSPGAALPDGTGLGSGAQVHVDADAVTEGQDGLNWAAGFTSVAGTWLPTTTSGAPSARSGHTAIWTGNEMIVWGGQNALSVPTATGGLYDPTDDAWFPPPTVGAPSARTNHTATWTGNSMIVWGGSGSQGQAISGGIIFFGGDDLDGDGICSTSDCDDSNPNCSTDCTDQDDDNWCLPADCYDLAAACIANCVDADGDGVPVCAPDCDDANPHCRIDCTDADADGWCVTTDCDDTRPACAASCADADADGYCVTDDCDDQQALCRSDCTDADGDGAAVCQGDCDDANPNCLTDCTDADADAYCVTDDCDDQQALCTSDCTDVDGDGAAVCQGDCDDTNPNCLTDCTDADADGYCVTDDCDDARPSCAASCADADGDGYCFDEDCDDARPFCGLDCSDVDGDGYCPPFDCLVNNPHCQADCTDADTDGHCVTDDCDDQQALCTSDCTDADADGLCAGADCNEANPHCTTLCNDPDGDGYCAPFDCLVNNPHCQADCTDADADGYCVTDDCDDQQALCTSDCTDADADGFCVGADCNDANPHCTTDCTDQDGDGYCAPFDCLVNNPQCTTDCTDQDGDGYCVTTDCDDTRPNCAASCTDADADGYCLGTDCDEANPRCTTDCTDQDGDGYCVTTDCDDLAAACTTDCTDGDADGRCSAADCDDANPHCTSDCTDQDGDGYCVTTDCDDTTASCATGCLDVDGDGFSPCGGDCNDADPEIRPGGTEVCTDGADNDCDGLTDNQDAVCSGLASGELRFDTETALHWAPAPSADAHALYRGSIGETGMKGYSHLCEATLLASAQAVDADVPPPGQGFYYLAAGLSIDPAGAIAAGSLGTSSSGAARQDRSGLSCGTRVYVDADVVTGGHTGLSWADAYTSVGAALGHLRGAGRGIEVWSRQSILGTASASGPLHPGLRLLGGFDGTETVAWERSPELNPTVWDGGGGLTPLLTSNSADVVIDGVTLRSASGGVRATVDGDHIVLENVRLELMTGWGIDLEVIASGRVVVEDVEVDSPGQGSVRALVRNGVLEGRIRRNTLDGGAGGAIVLEARPTATGASANVRVDVVANTVTGGARGIVLGARVDNRAATALQSSFVDSNVVRGTVGDTIAVEATGTFTTVSAPATVRSAPIVSNNTLDGGQAAGIGCRAVRSDTTGNPAVHAVSAVPELRTNLVTHHAGRAIEESSDNEATGLVSDPFVVVANGFHANGALYVDEGTQELNVIADVNALAGAAGNFTGDPLYVDRGAADYHLRFGTVLGAGSPMRYLANAGDPGLGLSWTLASFDDASWDLSAYGVGYDAGPDSPPPASAAALLATEVPAGTLSVFTRTLFEVADASAVTSLVLGADYDDGYVAWVNGVEVFRSASMPPGSVTWDTAAAPHESSNGSVPAFEEIDITALGIPLLVDGTNVLAIGVFNASAASADLVLVPRLVVDEESPAVDAGSASAPRIGKEDRDGGARLRDGNGDGVARADAGAHER